MLDGLALGDRVVTGDAAFCHRDLGRAVVEAGGHFLWKVDSNQPKHLADVEAACEPPVSPLRPQAGPR